MSLKLHFHINSIRIQFILCPNNYYQGIHLLIQDDRYSATRPPNLRTLPSTRPLLGKVSYIYRKQLMELRNKTEVEENHLLNEVSISRVRILSLIFSHGNLEGNSWRQERNWNYISTNLRNLPTVLRGGDYRTIKKSGGGSWSCYHRENTVSCEAATEELVRNC
jgi:hypothetical protein